MSGPAQCNNCMKQFGLFRRVRQCPTCNAALCKDCIKYNIDGRRELVCRKCHIKANTKKKSSSGNIEPPANFTRRIAKEQQVSEALSYDPEDEEIAKRLQKLKQSNQFISAASSSSNKSKAKDASVEEIQRRMEKLRASNPTITEEELEYRLLKLQNKPRPAVIKVHSIKRKHSDVPSSSMTSDDMQIKKLIRQYTQEIEIEQSSSSTDMFVPDKIPEDPSADDLIQLAQTELKNAEDLHMTDAEDNDMMQRLEALKEQNEESGTSEPMDSETADLIKRILEEDRLEQSMRDAGISIKLPTESINKEDEEEEEELPWCFMCNADATVKCITCEDLYCNKCFKIAHDKYDLKAHNYEKYK